MKKDELRVPNYLGHILEAAERIKTYTEDMDEVGFLQNHLVQDAVIRNIEVIHRRGCTQHRKTSPGIRWPASRHSLGRCVPDAQSRLLWLLLGRSGSSVKDSAARCS